MQYRLVRSKRRTLAITIDGSGHCTVRAPLRMPQAEIAGFVAEKEGWIKTKLLEIKIKAELAPQEPQFACGAEWLIGGRRLRLVMADGVPAACARITDTELVCGKGMQRSQFIAFLRRYALDVLCRRVNRFAPLVKVVPQGVKVSEAGARWGSCSGRNVLNFSWRLIFAPPPLLDYVVVHELCHIGCMNHSAEFWRRVAAVLPDYEARRRALKQQGYLLKWLR